MDENMKQSPIKVALKKAWPFIHRVVNATVYLMFVVVRNIFQGILEQFKGKMRY